MLHELSGCAHADAVYLADCTIEKLEMRGLDLYNGFFVFERNKIGNVRLERFRRRYDLDKNAATKATLYISGQTCAIAADIVSLDSILRTRQALSGHPSLPAAPPLFAAPPAGYAVCLYISRGAFRNGYLYHAVRQL